jgi:hypothetical protein
VAVLLAKGQVGRVSYSLSQMAKIGGVNGIVDQLDYHRGKHSASRFEGSAVERNNREEESVLLGAFFLGRLFFLWASPLARPGHHPQPTAVQFVLPSDRRHREHELRSSKPRDEWHGRQLWHTTARPREG